MTPIEALNIVFDNLAHFRQMHSNEDFNGYTQKDMEAELIVAKVVSYYAVHMEDYEDHD